MHPASGYLFIQGQLSAELEGRVKRLREEARDLEPEHLADDDATIVEKLVTRYNVQDVLLMRHEAEVVESEGSAGAERALRIPFAGNAVVFLRASDDTSRHDLIALPGRVLQKAIRVDGHRQLMSWVEIPVPISDVNDETLVAWRQEILHDLGIRLRNAHAHLVPFRDRLRKMAIETVAMRRRKLSAEGSVHRA